MAKYDSPGYPDQVPGYPPQNSHDYMTAPGEATGWHHSPRIAGGQFSGLPGVGSVLPLEWTDTGGNVDPNLPNQQDLYATPGRDTFTNVDGMGDSGAGEGHANHFAHPNSLGVHRD